MVLTTMYPGKINSPETTVAVTCLIADDHVHVADLSVFPAAPNLAVLGSDESAETILYAAKSAASGAGTLDTVTRAFQGTAIEWAVGTIISRNFTAYDYDTLRTNEGTLDTDKANLASPTFTGTVTIPALKVTTGAAAGDILISDADGDLAYLAAGATTDLLVGGGAANPVWTAATGTGSPVRAASPTLSGTPIAVTAAADTDTTQIATCQFVLNQASDTVAVADGVAAAGSSERYSRYDHVHPIATPNGTVTLFAAGSIQPVTSPATLGIAETTTNKVNYIYAEFPEDAAAILQWFVEMPAGWDEGNITPTFCWTPVAGEAAQTCKWVITAIKIGNDVALDTAFATGTDATDTWLGIGDYHEVAGSAFTPSGTTGGKFVMFKVIRDYANDTLVGISRLLAVRIKYTTTMTY